MSIDSVVFICLDGSGRELIAKYHQKIHHIEKEEYLKSLKTYHENMLIRCVEYKQENLNQPMQVIADEYSGASKKKLESSKPPGTLCKLRINSLVKSTHASSPAINVVAPATAPAKPQVAPSPNTPPKIVFKLGKVCFITRKINSV